MALSPADASAGGLGRHPVSPLAQLAQPSAADVAAARDLFRDAARLAKEGKWEEARAAYERSMALRPSALTRYSLAVAQKETGRIVEATENLRAFLREATDRASARFQAPAEELLRSLEPRIAKVTVSLASQPEGLVVTIDGVTVPAAAFGVARAIDPGKHRLEAKAAGHKAFSRQIELAEGGSERVAITLEPDRAAPGTGPAAAMPAPVASAAVPAGQPEKPRSASPLALGLTVGGGAALVGGVVVGLVGVSKAGSSETRDGSGADSARRLALVGDITAGVRLVAAGVGVYLLLWPPSPARREAGWLLTPWAGERGAGIGAAGRF
jgi:hypothetical protein